MDTFSEMRTFDVFNCQSEQRANLKVGVSRHLAPIWVPDMFDCSIFVPQMSGFFYIAWDSDQR